MNFLSFYGLGSKCIRHVSPRVLMGVDVKPTNDDRTRPLAPVQSRTCQRTVFIFAVRTTGIYCLPSCPARRPHRENVEFFDDPGSARPPVTVRVLRCSPTCPLRSHAMGEPLSPLEDRATSHAGAARAWWTERVARQRTFTARLVQPASTPSLCGASPPRRPASGRHLTDAIYDSGFNSSSAATRRRVRTRQTPRRWRRGKGEQISSVSFRPIWRRHHRGDPQRAGAVALW